MPRYPEKGKQFKFNFASQLIQNLNSKFELEIEFELSFALNAANSRAKAYCR